LERLDDELAPANNVAGRDKGLERGFMGCQD
jgi:hypothetical protein